jgi:glycosyltransferase involved in cell wall biosynthesis
MATGVPVVTTDVNVLPEIIEDKINGFVVPPENPYDMAEAIVKILEDDSLQQKISKQNLVDLKNKYEMKVVAAAVINIYKRLVN